jgi:hypothetical protein
MSAYNTFFKNNFFFHFGGPIKIFPCNKKTTYLPLVTDYYFARQYIPKQRMLF